MQNHQRLSRLEAIHCEILHRIAFLATFHSCSCSDAGSTARVLPECVCTQAPTALLCLLQTSSSIYRQLSITARPALYADLFFSTFDTQALSRRYSTSAGRFQGDLTSSALAAEFVNRCRLLRRVRRGDTSLNGLTQDLWTALWMLLESDGINEVHLGAMGFSPFIINVALSHLDPHPNPRKSSISDGGHIPSHSHSHSHTPSLNAIIIWLLSLSVRRDVIMDMPKHDRASLIRCIFPFMFGTDKANTKRPASERQVELGGHSQHPLDADAHELKHFATSVHDRQDVVSMYGMQSKPLVPDPAGAAIQLVFALMEIDISLQMPPHLPETRALANGLFRTGPTKKDFLAFASYRTPLHSDSLYLPRAEHPCVASHHTGQRSARHDVQFRDVLDILRHPLGSVPCILAPCKSASPHHIVGSLTGLWEGVTKNYVNIPGIATEAAMKPLAFNLVEFFRPVSCTSDISENDINLWGDMPPELYHPKQDYLSLRLKNHVYMRFIPTAGCAIRNRDIRHGVVLLGETTEEFSRAWGKAYFFGRVHSDGAITLRCHLKTIGGNFVLHGRTQSEIVITGYLTIGLPILGGSTSTHSAFSLRRAFQRS